MEAIPAEHRALFDRLHNVILAVEPDVKVALSYKMPSYKVGKRRLHLAAWQHGISLYGWGQDRAADFLEKHPQLKTSKGTIQLRPEDAARISDEELRELICRALAP